MNERIEFIKNGLVLGVQTVKQQLILGSILVDQLQNSTFKSQEAEIIRRAALVSGAIMLILLLVEFLFYGFLELKRLKNIMMIGLMGLIVFGFQVWYQYQVAGYADAQLNSGRMPKAVMMDRLGLETVTVEWETSVNSLGAVLWGYDASHLDKIQLSSSGEHKEKQHQVVLSVAIDKPVYLVIVSDGYKYWQDQSSQKPYELGVDNKYELEDVQNN